MNRSMYLLLHKNGNADKPGRVPSIETNGSNSNSTVGGVRPPISVFPNRLLPVLNFHLFIYYLFTYCEKIYIFHIITIYSSTTVCM